MNALCFALSFLLFVLAGFNVDLHFNVVDFASALFVLGVLLGGTDVPAIFTRKSVQG